jgi:hypothetical protein
MQILKPAGRNAPALKYDILSALAVYALSGDKNRQRLVLRVITLITTRYNWRTNELSMGREEIARLWNVNERTVKRELAKLKTMNWLSVKRAGARGRVTVYALDMQQMMTDTRAVWDVIGPDFKDRVAKEDTPEPQTNVVPFQPLVAVHAEAQGSVWLQVQEHLHSHSPELWSSWFRHLEEAERAGGTAVLLAPSRFVADYISSKWLTKLSQAYALADPSIRRIRVVTAEG